VNITIVPLRHNQLVRQHFGGKLRSFRIAQGLSQEKLGELAELDRTYISSVERGQRNVSLDAITRLAEALHISPRDFFDPSSSTRTAIGAGRK